MRILLVIGLLALLSACHAVVQPELNNIPPQIKPEKTKVPFQYIDIQNAESDFSAHWLAPGLIFLPKDNQAKKYSLAKHTLTNKSFQSIELQKTKSPAWLAVKYPHLKDFQALRVQLSTTQVKQWLRTLPFVVAIDELNNVSKVAYVQTGFVLDALYTQRDNDADEAPDLGATVTKNAVQFKLWAPTALDVKVLLFNADKSPAQPESLLMIEDTSTGIWSVQADASLTLAYYQYAITLYHPETRALETVILTDPYSLSLSTNSEYSQLIDLNVPTTKPVNWDTHHVPVVENHEDNVFYEMHIRDFSSSDPWLSDDLYAVNTGPLANRIVPELDT